MRKPIQTLVRWLIAIIIVALPLSYLLWQWRFAEHKELAALSYEAFDARLSGSDGPVYWPYGLYVLALVIIVVSLVGLIAAALRLVFPGERRAGEAPKQGAPAR